jgi:hypothetical protein
MQDVWRHASGPYRRQQQQACTLPQVQSDVSSTYSSTCQDTSKPRSLCHSQPFRVLQQHIQPPWQHDGTTQLDHNVVKMQQQALRPQAMELHRLEGQNPAGLPPGVDT